MEFLLMWHDLEEMRGGHNNATQALPNHRNDSLQKESNTIEVDFSKKLGCKRFASPLFAGQLLYTDRKYSDPYTKVYREAFHSPDSLGILSKTTSTGEIRFGGEFKEKPNGRLLIAVELDSPKMEWSPSTTILSFAVLNLLSLFSPGLRWSVGDPSRGIHPHIAFPLIACADDLIIENGKKGKKTDLLEIDEGDKHRRWRQAGGWREMEEGLQPGFTMKARLRLFYVDFAKWTACDLPLVDTQPLSRWWGDAGFRFSIYEEVTSQEKIGDRQKGKEILKLKVKRLVEE